MFPYHQAIEQNPGPATMDKTKESKGQLSSASMEWDYLLLTVLKALLMIISYSTQFCKSRTTNMWIFTYVWKPFSCLYTCFSVKISELGISYIRIGPKLLTSMMLWSSDWPFWYDHWIKQVQNNKITDVYFFPGRPHWGLWAICMLITTWLCGTAITNYIGIATCHTSGQQI